MSDKVLFHPLKEGSTFPIFELLDQDKKLNFLPDLIEAGLVIAFLPKLTAVSSVQKILELTNEQHWLKKNHIAIVGLCSEIPEKLLRFSEEYFISFPLLFDENSKIARAAGVLTLTEFLGKEFLSVFPTFFFIDQRAVIQSVIHAESEFPKPWFQKIVELISQNKRRMASDA